MGIELCPCSPLPSWLTRSDEGVEHAQGRQHAVQDGDRDEQHHEADQRDHEAELHGRPRLDAAQDQVGLAREPGAPGARRLLLRQLDGAAAEPRWRATDRSAARSRCPPPDPRCPRRPCSGDCLRCAVTAVPGLVAVVPRLRPPGVGLPSAPSLIDRARDISVSAGFFGLAGRSPGPRSVLADATLGAHDGYSPPPSSSLSTESPRTRRFGRGPPRCRLRRDSSDAPPWSGGRTA